jgi:hypothetical protein
MRYATAAIPACIPDLGFLKYGKRIKRMYGAVVLRAMMPVLKQ